MFVDKIPGAWSITGSTLLDDLLLIVLLIVLCTVALKVAYGIQRYFSNRRQLKKLINLLEPHTANRRQLKKLVTVLLDGTHTGKKIKNTSDEEDRKEAMKIVIKSAKDLQTAIKKWLSEQKDKRVEKNKKQMFDQFVRDTYQENAETDEVSGKLKEKRFGEVWNKMFDIVTNDELLA